ncbi:M28 family peptidase [Thermoflexibacter ruber]|uniref:Peptidase family M28 n=1 Tax=Thermoflexibacter ruber TaxID=1003 RepID=A0A1I2A850_9BACT|nr:M28 family peptidase [Thermoflexibacter ruber]SFE38990.1 Peptidase family M28 [Thermoflexibacter ruber]
MKQALHCFFLFIAFTLLLANPLSAQGKFNALQLLTDIKVLSSDEFQGRKVGSSGSKKAQEYIIKRFLEYKLMPFDGYFEQNFAFTPAFSINSTPNTKINGTNLIGYIEGKLNKDMYIVLTAHYDHLGIRNNEIYNGADDNASGVAGLFAIAEYFQKNKPDHSIIFVAVDAEEMGLKGAYHFVDNPPVPKEKIVMNINIDMISRNEKNEIYACGTYHYPFLKNYMSKNTVKHEVTLKYGHDVPESISGGAQDWTFASDHGPFHKASIPFIYFGVEDHPDYHRPTDRFDTINQVFFIKATELILDYVILFDKYLKAVKNDKVGK